MRTEPGGLMPPLVAALLLLAALAPAFAAAEISEFDIPQPPAPIACLGESVAGMFHVREVLHVRSSANGGFHLTSNWRLTGLLQGLTSGTTWTFRGASNVSRNAQGNQSTFTASQPLTGVAPGKAPTIVAHFQIVQVIDANGTVKSLRFVNSIRCRGRR